MSSGGSIAGRQHFANLEAMRGIAALAVVLHHLAMRPGTILSGNLLLAQGWLFVDLFFVLSGFVIASVHAECASDGQSAGRFLIRRFFRLYPLHLATLAAALVLDVQDGTATLPGYGWMLGFNLTMTHAWGFVPGSVLNGPSWSISVEWAAYCLFALVCLVVRSPRARVAVMVAIGLASLLLLLVYRGGSLDGDLTLRLPRCLMSFALGMATWWWMRGRPPLNAAIAARSQLACAVAMVAILPLTAAYAAAALLMPLASATMIALMVRDPGSLARRALDRSVPQWLGRHSYSLYLVHMPLFEFSLLFGGVHLQPNVWAAMVLAMLGVVSAITYAVIEAPWRDRGRRIASTFVIKRESFQII